VPYTDTDLHGEGLDLAVVDQAQPTVLRTAQATGRGREGGTWGGEGHVGAEKRGSTGLKVHLQKQDVAWVAITWERRERERERERREEEEREEREKRERE